MILLTLLLLTVSAASGSFFDYPFSKNELTATYSAKMLCGECLLNNHVFCVKGAEGIVVDKTLPTNYTTFCCNNTNNCTYIKDKAWNCSAKYTNQVDKYKVCPFYKSQCGPSPKVNLTGVGDAKCLKLNAL